MAHKIGSKVRVAAYFTFAKVANDPDGGVTLKVKAPTGVQSTYEYGVDPDLKNEDPEDPQASATGHYYRDVVPDVAGEWYYRWIGAGSCEAADEDRFRVDPSPFT